VHEIAGQARNDEKEGDCAFACVHIVLSRVQKIICVLSIWAKTSEKRKKHEQPRFKLKKFVIGVDIGKSVLYNYSCMLRPQNCGFGRFKEFWEVIYVYFYGKFV